MVNKKLLSLLLCLAMTLGLCGMAAAQEEVVTLQYYSEFDMTHNIGPVKGWVADLYREHGIALEVLSSSPEKTQALLASGDLPDLVKLKDMESYLIALDAGMILNLDEYMDRLPNVEQNLGRVLEYYRKYASNGTDAIYGTPDQVGTWYYPVDNDVYGIKFRWDLYQAVGAPEIQTLEDMIPVLKEMQALLPETEDGTRTYAFNMFSGWDGGRQMANLATFQCALGYAEGTHQNLYVWDLKTNEVTSIFDRDMSKNVFLRGLKFLYDLNQAGLLDPDAINLSYDQAATKLESGAYLAIGWAGYDSGYNTDDHKNAEPPTGYMPVIFDELYTTLKAPNAVGGGPLCISANIDSSKLDAALEYINLASDYDMNLILRNAPEGERWMLDESGTPVATQAYFDSLQSGTSFYLSNGEEYVAWSDRPTFLHTDIHPVFNVPYRMDMWDDVTENQVTSKLYDEWEAFYGYRRPIHLLEAEDRIVTPVPLLFTEVAPDDIQATLAAVRDVVYTASWQMIYAQSEEEFNQLFDSMEKTAMEMGAQEVIDYNIGALEANIVKSSEVIEELDLLD